MLAAVIPGLAAQSGPTEKIDFSRDIQPILRARCFSCHGPQLQSNGLRLDRREDAFRGGYSGQVIHPGESASSRLYQLITNGVVAEGKRIVMPPTGPLPETETLLIRRWIDEGAVWPAETESASKSRARARPWSFEPIHRPSIPAVRHASWVRNPIDAFVLAKLEAAEIEPSPQAPRSVLLRRVYLDLTGLPPTPEEVAAFLGDQQPGNYERLVDRLLRSEHYGEKWARSWLDVARYADSEGGVQDYVRPFAWRYRHWVIDALNRDMPFDQFTTEQIAGDLLPASTLEQKLATGFQRNTITSREGGIDLEKLRFDQLVDRANTVGSAWLGLTVGCAQCHDHKYDPISQKDYYRLLAFFENSDEVDIEAPLPGELGPYQRRLPEYRRERQNLLQEYKVAGLQAEWEDNLRDSAAHPGKRTDWDTRYDSFCKTLDHGIRILHTDPARRTQREQDAMTDLFVQSAEGSVGKKRYEELRLKELAEKLTALSQKNPPLSLIPTLAEDRERHPSFIRVRGNYKDKGVEVTRGTPESLPTMPAGAPADRLALARWIVSRENPLTARVAVNRSWQELFGRGLVRTSEDFGMQGEKPSYPELLDWLAARFVDGGWSMKALNRMIVTSATYRQSSRIRPDLLTRDPGNALLARQSRVRLPAELIRDSALAVSGLLLDTVGGESVRPPQPEGIADQSYSLKWVETAGTTRYRRGLYIQTQRTAMYPLLGNFDAPDRTVTCARRENSNTPLQALNLMNDPVFTEAAQALASRLLKASGTEQDRVKRAFMLCYARPPSPKDLDTLLTYLQRRRALAQADDSAAPPLSAAHLADVNPADATAWFGLSRALMNSDEFINRE
jgi:hypothetical protein